MKNEDDQDQEEQQLCPSTDSDDCALCAMSCPRKINNDTGRFGD